MPTSLPITPSRSTRRRKRDQDDAGSITEASSGALASESTAPSGALASESTAPSGALASESTAPSGALASESAAPSGALASESTAPSGALASESTAPSGALASESTTPSWCAVHIVSRTHPLYRAAVDRSQTFASVLAEYKKCYLADRDEAAFFSCGVEIFPTSVIGECPRVTERMVLVQALLPQEAMCVRAAEQIAREPSFWDTAATEGVLSKEAFVEAVGALQIHDCDPVSVWSLSMGEATSADRQKFDEHFSTYECITETKLFATREADSPILCNIIVGAAVTLLEPPETIGHRLLGHVATCEHTGFVTLALSGTLLFQRSFAFLEPLPADLSIQATKEEVRGEDKMIDDAIGLTERDEEMEDAPSSTHKPTARKASGRPRLAQARIRRVQKDIERLQRTTDLLIPRSSFVRAVKESLDSVQQVKVAKGEETTEYRISTEALKVLQECAEHHVTSEFSKLRLLASHRKAVTIDVRDHKMLNLLRG